MRRCRRCGEDKPRSEFLPGKLGGFGRSCESCLKEKAHEMDAIRERGRARHPVTWEVDGVLWRRCKTCPAELPLAEGFYLVRSTQRGTERYEGRCKACHMASVREAEQRRLGDSALRQRDRERSAVLAKRWAEEHPERVKERRKEDWQRLKADPERHAARLEAQRMNYRLRRQRRGLPVEPVETLNKRRPRKIKEPRRLLPSAPLGALVGRMIEHREVIAEAINEPSFGKVTEVCQDLGITDRAYRRWRSGEQETVRIDLAERVILNADVEPEDVYSIDDHREALELLTSREYVEALS